MGKREGFFKAKELLNKHYISSISDIDIAGLINVENGFYKYAPLTGAQGRIVFNGDNSIITVNSNITNVGKRRFVLAHELGHLYMHRRVQNSFFNCDAKALIDWNRKRPEETDANNFASEILMPEELFQFETGGDTISIQLIEYLQNRFNTSFTATAIRFIKLGYTPSCLIYSLNGFVKWSVFSENFPVQYMEWNIKIPSQRVANDVFETGSLTREVETMNLSDWGLSNNGTESNAKELLLMMQKQDFQTV